MRIAHNIAALQTNVKLNKTDRKIMVSSARLSSGYRINSSKDDAAGLSIVNKMSSQLRGMEMAERNNLDGISLVQTADGALGEIHEIIQRMRELAVESANGTLEPSDREKIDIEIKGLVAEIDAISKKTDFNGINLLNGVGTVDANGDPVNPYVIIQIGQNKSMEMKLDLEIVNSVTLGIDQLDYTTQEKSEEAIEKCDKALNSVSKVRARFGAYQNALDHNSSNLGVLIENLTTARSRIWDTDMAREMTEYTQNSVISQAGISVLAQANQRPQQILQLLN